MAAQEAAFYLFSSLAPRFSISSLHAKPSSFPSLSQTLSFPSVSFSILPFRPLRRTPLFEFQLCSAVQEISVQDEEEEQSQNSNQRKKLFVLNLPWSFTVEEIKNIFGECGTVADVEIIKQKDGKSRGFAFITMDSGEEAQAVISKFDSQELSGRIIRVDFAKRLKKPSKNPPVRTQTGEARYKLYVSNLAWKVRSTHLKELFSSDFNPISTRVVFDNPSGKSAGYGFVSFATKEEAESAISSLDGKELLGRPIRLKISERNAENSEIENGEVKISERNAENSEIENVEVPAIEESEQSQALHT
ncbi:29 kDa ribonucleoprotein A, chloroplastic [Impatiens glandulifera]|uniref:29 kDa ribonucleoprotein A, chloroplastic n=1 Tax=Impatiens glandulifera TaxID=253017 RepID=UPI001FB0F01A|nr:29 kDa ribonucleoprotein A, chloroplastic [Impatiens glandulifera]